MKLALFLHGGVDRSGTERVIPSMLWLIERLARDHDLHVFAHSQERSPATWDLRGARVHNVGTEGGWRRRLSREFRAEHRAAPFDVIHGIFAWGGMWGGILGARHRVPVLFHPDGGEFVALRDVDYGARRTMRGRVQVRIAITGATRVTVSSRYMQRLATRFGVNAEVVPIGVALDQWPPRAPRHRDAARPARLLHVGDLRGVKDQRTLVAAVHRLHADGRDVDLDIAGEDTMAGALQTSSIASALGDKLRVHGRLPRAALRSLMERADLLVMSSRHEAGPVAVLEAAIAGVPTVGTAVGHIADWAPDAALAVPVGDDAALADAIGALLDDEPHRFAMAREAQRRAIASDADATAASYVRVYEELRAR